jgi:hypothetical protein
MRGHHRPTDQLSVIDELTTLPFPDHETRPGEDRRWGGPGYHLTVLRESRDFWDDRSEDVVEAAELELESDLAALVTVLTGRWGDPQTVDLSPYLDGDDPDLEAPEPLASLCGVAGGMRVWRLPASDRWLALTIGQADAEWPFELLAAVGEASSLPR